MASSKDLPSLPPFPSSFAIAGAGRVATAAGILLTRAGHSPRGVWSRTPRSAERASQLLDTPVRDAEELAREVDLVLIGTSDPHILATAARLATSAGGNQVFVHFAGSLALEPLEPVARVGAFVAALHPVQACPSIEAAVARLPGSAWGVTCEERLTAWVVRLIGDLGGNAVAVGAEDRELWHAAAVATSNGLAAILALGEAILASIAADPAAVLGPLVRGTLQNASEGGGGGATLTGPAVRGEVETISRHMSALRARDPRLSDAYARVTRTIVAGARLAGRIDDHAAGSIEAAVEG